MRHQPIVYVFVDPSWDLLYIGKTSDIDGRFSDYFKYDTSRGCLVKQPELWTDRPEAFFVAVVPDAVMKPLEEYLLWRLRPPSNKRITSSPPSSDGLECT